ncbi:Rne/Rng family ribonuclease [Paracoccus albus]|uniref:Rne/Rng family ribonuclease n=1 Tax=Paracoccus albus TaxID=3017784 RepID=UPI0022F10A47|nr:ribonuclease E/G [Paracoccus albus]WBU58971.1 ribonuclease E/G [Paracoccus albus]
MAKKMLIDATHAEETRVVVVDGTKVEEFDFETVNKRQLAGNIYLAKVTRVEPSLQAAFVDYGGNRHGFLAFAEIHPDYYQIPAADRQALIEEERAYAEAVAAEEAANEKPKSSRRRKAKAEKAETGDARAVSEDIPGMEVVDHDGDDDSSAAEEDGRDENAVEEKGGDAPDAAEKDDSIESVADEDVAEEIRVPKKPRPRRYKIQEVIKVRQILLVQVVKEERGNKGAALTTYLSLAGRYCVLMPNTARGGGISRKITNAADRKKLKDIAAELKVPQGAGLIIRTAGSQRTRTEIKRDYEYLMRLWEQIRDLTFKSMAPAPIYEEGDLIKRTIRDLYSREIDEVLVEGDRGYRTAKDFMKMIMPSHAKNVKHYHDPMPLYARYQVESYLGGMFNPTVQLKSGGYIVIGVTEALVAIDVNSGRATKEGSIEDTATKTNLEAADEIARQLRLRDLAGLIVIDFIDMDERKNNSAVEKRLKDRLKTDRARIQVGKISGFGLLEMSRQRLRPGMLESTTQPCAHCHGTGLIRSDDSLALTILRAIEEEGTRKRSREVLVKAPVAVSNFLMNGKREHIAMIEARYGMSVRVEADPVLISPDFALEKFKTATRSVPELAAPVVSVDAQLMAQIDDDEDQTDTADDSADSDDRDAKAADRNDGEDNGEGGGRSKRRRRRRRRGGKDRTEGSESSDETRSEEVIAAGSEQPADAAADAVEAAKDEPSEEGAKPKSRSRSRTRTRRKTEARTEAEQGDAAVAAAAAETTDTEASVDTAEIVDLRDLTRTPSEPAESVDPVAVSEAEAAVAEEQQATAPQVKKVAEAPAPEAEPVMQPSEAAADAPNKAVAETVEEAPTAKPTRPKRRGWWSMG